MRLVVNIEPSGSALILTSLVTTIYPLMTQQYSSYIFAKTALSRLPKITSTDLAPAVTLSAGLQADVVRHKKKASIVRSELFFLSRLELCPQLNTQISLTIVKPYDRMILYFRLRRDSC